MKKNKNGLFVGMSTIDFIQYVDSFPAQNEKSISQNLSIYAGGPAANSSIAFAYFRNHSTLITRLGCNPLADIVKDDLASNGVEVYDADLNHQGYPNISSVTVTESTGDRSVVCTKGTFKQTCGISLSLENTNIFLVDGHNLDIAIPLLKKTKDYGVRVVLDAGSWKNGMEEVIAYVDYAICSENFTFPDSSDICEPEETLMSFSSRGVKHIAITRGGNSILGFQNGSLFSLDVPQVKTVDTLGAGDIFHGAFSHYILEADFKNALRLSAIIASNSCKFSGPRKWMES